MVFKGSGVFSYLLFAVLLLFYRMMFSGGMKCYDWCIIEDDYEAIKELCVRYRVRWLELFGSALTGSNFNPEKSDLDFLVEFLPLKQGEYADAYFGFLEALEDLFNKHVVLVMNRAIKNPYFLESINKNRKVLYAA